MNKQLIIVPDVHGRTFWKEVKNYDCEIVFLGDYVDPYFCEDISKEMALDNFKDILFYAQTHSNVHLLVGNHDLEYAIGTHICDVRRDEDNYEEIQNLFSDHKDLFNLAYECTINNKRFLLTHSGITEKWYDAHCVDFKCKLKEFLHAEILNDLYKRMPFFFENALGEVSAQRGGNDPSGSIVWADIHEHLYPKEKRYPDVYQIVGHTWLSEAQNWLNKYRIACLDAQACFYLDEEGRIRYLNTDEELKGW